ncbi:MAG: Tm-1-like ATP-binding domain-containing protein [Pirellulales bacterium]
MPDVYLVATMDTKGHELQFVADRMRCAGVSVKTVDVGTLSEPQVKPDIDRHQVSAGQWIAGAQKDRGQAVDLMSGWLTEFLRDQLAKEMSQAF